MKMFLLLLCALASNNAWAKFGGSRSSSGPATITRRSSISIPTPTRPTIYNHTTVVRPSSGNGGLLTGILIGHALSQPQTQAVVDPNNQMTSSCLRSINSNNVLWFLTAILFGFGLMALGLVFLSG